LLITNPYSGYGVEIHKLVKYKNGIINPTEKKKMKQNLSFGKRKKLQEAVMSVFEKEIRILSPELQKILTDDLVTAFQNRLNTLHRIHTNAVL
jgi:hypothetical protein